MEYLLLAIALAEGGYIIHLKSKKPTEKQTEDKKEAERKERIEKDFQKLFNYSETIATRGYKDEE